MGLFRRKNSRIWWMSFSVNGKQYLRSTGTHDKKFAEAILAKIKTQILEGKWFDVDTAKQYTFNDMMEKYFKEHASVHKEQSTLRRDFDSYSHLKMIFAGLTLDRITPELVVGYRNKRLSGNASHSTILNELGLLRNAFNISIKNWRWCKENPVSQVKLNLKARQIDRWLSYGEQERLLIAAKNKLLEQLSDIIILALNTGMRNSEILSLKNQDVDFSRKTLVVMKSKTKGKQTIPLNNTAFELLIRRSKVIPSSRYVFSTGQGTRITARNLNRAFYKAIKKANISSFRFHDIRHTFATRLVQSGVNLYKVSKLLGHKDISTTQRYAHHYPESLRDGVEILDGFQEKNLSQQAGVLRFYYSECYNSLKTLRPLSSVG